MVQGGAAGGRLVRVRVGGDGPAAQRALRHARQLSELQASGRVGLDAYTNTGLLARPYAFMLFPGPAK